MMKAKFLTITRLLPFFVSALCPVVAFGGMPGCIFSPLRVSDGLSDNEVQHILQLDDGRMAITTASNINIYDGSRFSYVHYNPAAIRTLAGYGGASHVYMGNDSLIWIKNYRQLQCFDLGSLSYKENIDSVVGPAMRGAEDFFIDSGREIWIFKEGMLLNAATDNIYRPALPQPVQDLETAADTLMLFYPEGGVERILRKSKKSLGVSRAYADGGSYRCTSLVVKRPQGGVYQIRTGQSGSILVQYDCGSDVWREIMRVDYPLHTLSVDPDGDALISSRGGVWHVDGETLAPTLLPALDTTDGVIPATDFNTIVPDRLGGIWIGTYFRGLLYGHPMRRMLRSAESLVRLGADENTLRHMSGEKVSDSERRVNCRFRDREGNVWTGTSDGLTVITSGGDSLTVRSEQGLSSDNVKAILGGARGDVWISTSNGINCVKICGGEVSVAKYGSRRGAMADEYLAGEGYAGDDGRLFFRSRSGWTVIDGLSTAKSLRLPVPLICNLKRNESSVSFDIVSLNYLSPDETKFEVSVSRGGDRDSAKWEAVRGNGGDGTLTMNLMHLRPGNYTVMARTAADGDGAWSDTAEVRFCIPSPWYLTGSAIALYCISALLVGGGLVWLYRRAELRRLDRRHKEEAMMTRIQDLIGQCCQYESMLAEGKSAAEKEVAAEREEPGGFSVQDREFVDRAVALVEKNLTTKGYTVDMLAKDLCMERTGLYKRMMGLLDESPSAFIRSVRMRHAERLLREGRLSVGEVAETTGFSSTSHMSKAFSDKHGCTPLEYRKRHESAS